MSHNESYASSTNQAVLKNLADIDASLRRIEHAFDTAHMMGVVIHPVDEQDVKPGARGPNMQLLQQAIDRVEMDTGLRLLAIESSN